MMAKNYGAVLILVTCIGCGSAGETKAGGDAPAAAVSAASVRSRSTSKESTRVERPQLAEDQIRVPLFVVPGDAIVEVDDVVVRRRNGTIELVGKVGEERRVRVFSGMTQTYEKNVRIEAAGTSPSTIDVRAVSMTR